MSPAIAAGRSSWKVKSRESISLNHESQIRVDSMEFWREKGGHFVLPEPRRVWFGKRAILRLNSVTAVPPQLI